MDTPASAGARAGLLRALPARAVPALLHDSRDFRRFFAGETVSLVGDQITLIAVPLVAVLALDAGAAQMGYLTAAGLAPNLVFALHAGAWVDRRGRRRRTMIVADLVRAALLLSIPLAWAAGVLGLAQLFAVAFLVGTMSVFFQVSYSTLFVSIVSRERYVEANSLLSGARALSFVGGPALGGGIVPGLSAPLALVADAASYVVSAFFLRSIDPEEPPTEHAERGHVAGGIRFVLGSPVVRSALGATATINFFNFVFFALFVLYATRVLGLAPGTLGLVLGAGAVGGVVGAVLVSRVAERIGIGPAFALGCVLFPAPLLLVPLAEGPRPLVLGLLFLAEFGAGFGVMVLDISASSIFAALVPDRLRARVSGAYMVVNYGVRPLGALAGGALGATIGLRPTLWLATAGALLGVLWLLPSPILRLRTLDDAAAVPAE